MLIDLNFAEIKNPPRDFSSNLIKNFDLKPRADNDAFFISVLFLKLKKAIFFYIPLGNFPFFLKKNSVSFL